MALPRYTAGGTGHQPIPQGHGPTHVLTIHPKKPKAPKAKAASKPKVDPLDRPAGPGSSYTVRQLRDLVAAAADQKFGPQQRALEARQTAIPGWFAAYRNSIQQAADAQAQRTTNAVSTLQGLAGSAGAVDPNASPEAQAAAKVRAGLAGGQTQLAQILGDNQGTFLNNLGLLTNINQIAELSKAGSGLDELRRQRADYGQTYGQQVLSDEAKSRLEQILAANTLANGQSTRTHTKNQDKIAQKNANKPPAVSSSDAAFEDSHGGYTPKEWANLPYAKKVPIMKQNHIGPYKPTAKGSGTKDEFGNTPKDVQRSNDSWDKAKTTAKFYWSHGKQSFKGDWKQLAEFLVTAKNLNPLYARAAAQRIVNGSVDPKLAKQLRRRGVKVKTATPNQQTASKITSTIQQGLENIGGN